MNSYEKINYKLRPQKRIERALIAQLINNFQHIIGEKINYIGMGSLFYADFVYFNRYCDLNRINYNIPIEVTLETIIRYKQVFIQKKPDYPFDVNEVLYYIYRSVNKNYIKTFLYFLYSGDCFRLSFTC